MTTYNQRADKKALHEHLDMIVTLRARAALALELGIEETARGAQEDIRRRLHEVERLRRELGW